MKWEYKHCVLESIKSDEKTTAMIEDLLNRQGEQGWELVCFQSILLNARYVFIFKRPKEEKENLCIEDKKE